MKKLLHSLLICHAGVAFASGETFEEVYVTSDFSQSSIYTIPESVTVVGLEDILERSAVHLEQVLSFAPNVNFSAGSSRGRFFQIRGIGERSQFIDPVNPSVGLVIDGIDMTGLGGAATLFDVQQVEILRGPQGTRFGANALAGMINIKSNDPANKFEGYAAARVGNYGAQGGGAALSIPLGENASTRLAVQKFESDGFIDNTFLNRDDTNNLDELVARGKLRIDLSENTQLGLTYLHTDVENGYDAFSLDNTRETLSDEPGIDAQKTDALALNLSSKLSNVVTFDALTSMSQSDVEYSYDEDWTFVGIEPDWEYSSFDQYLREYDRASIDLRLSSGENGTIFSDTTQWVVGLTAMTRDEELERNYTFLPQFQSELDVESTAVYGELTIAASKSSRVIIGARLENWKNDYSDNNGTTGNTDENLVGGKLTFEQSMSDNQLAFISAARGYKAGGVNFDPDVSEENRNFDTEFNHVFEIGLKSFWSDDFRTAVNLFYIQRRDQQVKSSYVIQNENNSFTFQDFLSNAAEGTNRGIELEGSWFINDYLAWDFSYGYLDTEFSDYSFSTSDGEFNVTGRDQAHAPSYSGASALTVNITPEFSARFEIEAKDAFYFSDSHNLRSDAYELFHIRLEYATDNFSIELFARNLGNEDYATRGFGFANDPRDGYTSVGYTQFGEPRTYGVSGSITF